ncbi:MAG: tetratricopeptide repeat protein [Caldilineaceae bacterium]
MFKQPVIFNRWPVYLYFICFTLLIAACAVPRVPTAPGTKLKENSTSATTVEALGTATPTSTPFDTPKPGPTPTATPKPLAQADAAKAGKLVEEGKARFLKSDLTGAEGAFIDALAADPQNLDAHLGLTNAYLYLPQYWQQALTTAEAAVKLAPDDGVAQAYLSWAQQGAHRFEDAKKSAQHAAELAPDNATVQAALADVLSSVYELDDAYAAAKKAVQLDDQNAVAWSTLGSIAYTLENWDEATDAYDKAAKLEPDFFAWHVLQARHELNVSGDVETANELLQPALKVQPAHPWVLSFQVDAALEKNDWKTAEASCRKMFAVNQPNTPYPDAYSCMAGVMIVKEDYNDAEPYQAIAEKLATPYRRDISLLRMRLYNEKEQCSKARDLAQSWLDERPYSVLALRMVGVSYLCDENFDKAIEKFKQALDKMPRSVADARLLANAYARAGKAAEARAALNKVATFANQDPLYYQGLYEVYLFLGQHEDALKAVQRWQVLRPNNADAKVSLALAQLIAGNIGAAQSAAQSALDDGATGATLYAVLGQTYGRQGDFAKAEQYLLQSLAIADNNFLAHNFILSLYLAHGDCDKAAVHVAWLKANSKDSKNTAQLQDLIDNCKNRNALPTPDPKTALEDDAALDQVKTLLKNAGVEARSVRFSQDNQSLSLVVAFNTDADPKSKAFTDLEDKIALGLARLLPRIASQPDGLVLLSGAGDKPQNITYVSTKAASLWASGDLSDAEFQKTWVRRSADSLQQGGN